MKQEEYEIHANPGKVFDCACKVGVECDGETIALRFPQIDRDDDNIGPMVYAHMRGTELRVTLADRENADIEFAWDEGAGVWRACGTANTAGVRVCEAIPWTRLLGLPGLRKNS